MVGLLYPFPDNPKSLLYISLLTPFELRCHPTPGSNGLCHEALKSRHCDACGRQAAVEEGPEAKQTVLTHLELKATVSALKTRRDAKRKSHCRTDANRIM